MKTTREKYDKSVFGDFPAPTSLEKVFCKKKYEAVEKRNNPIDSKLFKD